jgi:hypothetical protein
VRPLADTTQRQTTCKLHKKETLISNKREKETDKKKLLTPRIKLSSLTKRTYMKSLLFISTILIVFGLNLENKAFGQISFAAPITHPINKQPYYLQTVDLNSDGINDILSVNQNSHSVGVLLGNGNGTFIIDSNYTVLNSPTSVCFADFNNDNKIDIATSNLTVNSVAVMLGNGAGQFSAPTYYLQNGMNTMVAWKIRAIDIDADGKMDLVVSTNAPNHSYIAVLKGNGLGTFSAPVYDSCGINTGDFVISNFNMDSYPDVVSLNDFTNEACIYLGSVNGNLSLSASFPMGNKPSSICHGDFNFDGKEDIAVANRWSNNFYIFMGNGAGNFSTPVIYNTFVAPESIITSDFNNDSYPDVAVALPDWNQVLVYQGTAAGTFVSPVFVPTGAAAKTVINGDFNGDNRMDLATGDGNGYSVSILLNQSPLYTGELIVNNFQFLAHFNAENNLHVELLNGTKIKVCVYDYRGQYITSEHINIGMNIIPFTSRPSGIYILKYYSESKLLKTEKVFKTI